MSQTTVSQTLDHMPTNAAALGNLLGKIQDAGTCKPLFVDFERDDKGPSRIRHAYFEAGTSEIRGR